MRPHILLLAVLALAACGADDRPGREPPDEILEQWDEPEPEPEPPVRFDVLEDGSLVYKDRHVSNSEFETILDKNKRLYLMGGGRRLRRGVEPPPRRMRVEVGIHEAVPLERVAEICAIINAQKPKELRLVFRNSRGY